MVAVIDNIAPSISCLANITTAATSASVAAVTYTTPVGSDNCSGATTARTAGPASGSTFPIGTTTVTHRVTDASGNTADCSFTVTVTGTAPTITCPPNITSNNDVNQCGAAVTYSNAPTITGLPAPNISYSLASGSFFPIGTTTVTATATNSVGSNSCTFTVNITDSQAPIFLQAVIPPSPKINTDYGSRSTYSGVNLNGQGNYINVNPGASINFSSSWSSVRVPGDPGYEACPGCITQHFLVFNGQMITCHDANQGSAGNLNVSFTAPSQPGVYYLTHTGAWCFGCNNPVGCGQQTTEVLLGLNRPDIALATIIVGNASICPADITVPATNASGAVVTYTTPVGSDNCGGAITIRTAGLASGSVFPIGVTTVTHRVTDASGNSTSCSFNVTVTGTAPGITCPINITANNDLNQCGANITYVNLPLATGNPTPVITYSHNSGSFFPVGLTTVTATAINTVGSNSCTFTVAVYDSQAPSIVCPNAITVSSNPASCDAIVTVKPPFIADNVNGNALNFDGLDDKVEVPDHPSLTMVNGLTIEAWVYDRAVNNPARITNNDNFFNILVKGTYGYGLAIDSRGALNNRIKFWDRPDGNALPISNSSLPSDQWVHVAVTVSDSVRFYLNGVLDGVSPNFGTVSSLNSPGILAIGNQGIGCAYPSCNVWDGQIDEIRLWNVARSSTDIVNNINGRLRGDESGLVAYYTFDQGTAGGVNTGLTTLVDGTVNRNNGTLLNFALSGGAASNWTAGRKGAVTITNNKTGTANASGTYPVGTTSVVWTATDAAGNASNCTQTVTVTDNQAPTATCQPVTAYLDNTGKVSVNALSVNNGSTDNCNILAYRFVGVGDNGGQRTVNVISGASTGRSLTGITYGQNGVTKTLTPANAIRSTLVLNTLTANPTLGYGGDANRFWDMSATTMNQSTALRVLGDMDLGTALQDCDDPVGVNHKVIFDTPIVPGAGPEIFIVHGGLAYDIQILDVNGNVVLTIPESVINSSSTVSLAAGSNFNAFYLRDNVNFSVEYLPGHSNTLDKVLALDINYSEVPLIGGIRFGGGPCNYVYEILGYQPASSQIDLTCANIDANAVTMDVIDASGTLSSCATTITVVDNIAPVLTNCPASIPLNLDNYNNSVNISAAIIDNNRVVISATSTVQNPQVGSLAPQNLPLSNPISCDCPSGYAVIDILAGG
ncbi:MAG: HYR domain-containing protein [Saprospiraceae bacterium]|nr:HYR domain-containing protein [Saprospiraceae bacterium]